MIVGHVGIAYGARALDKRDARSVAPLLWLLAASAAPDALDALFAVGKVCNPEGVFSHSIPAVAILGVIFGTAAFLHTRSAVTAFLVMGLVLLHLPPDYITGRKALWPGGPVWGLYLYRWGWADFLVELPVIVGGWWLLRRSSFTARWLVSGVALAAMLAVQAGFDTNSVVNGPRPARSCER